MPSENSYHSKELELDSPFQDTDSSTLNELSSSSRTSAELSPSIRSGLNGRRKFFNLVDRSLVDVTLQASGVEASPRFSRRRVRESWSGPSRGASLRIRE